MTIRQCQRPDAGGDRSVAPQRMMVDTLGPVFRPVRELGLMVYLPARWPCRLDRTRGQRIFLVDMPRESLLSWALGLNYPCVSEDHFERYARDCLQMALDSYNDRSASEIVRKRYDVLCGYEVSGTMESRGAPMDVRVCVGHVLGYPPVVLQATAPVGELASWAAVVTTLWNNVYYLDASAHRGTDSTLSAAEVVEDGPTLEIVEALKIISSLAKGKHPDTHEPVPPDSLFESPNVIRALYTAASALEILKRRRNRQPAANAGQQWSDEEDSRLVTQYNGGVTDLRELARLHERSEASIESRLIRHGLLEARQSIITARGRRPSDRATPRSDQNIGKAAEARQRPD